MNSRRVLPVALIALLLPSAVQAQVHRKHHKSHADRPVRRHSAPRPADVDEEPVAADTSASQAPAEPVAAPTPAPKPTPAPPVVADPESRPAPKYDAPSATRTAAPPVATGALVGEIGLKLAAVLALMAVCAQAWRRFGKRGFRAALPGGAPRVAERLEMVEQLRLGPQQALFLVRCRDRVLLVGGAGSALSLLADVTPAPGETPEPTVAPEDLSFAAPKGFGPLLDRVVAADIAPAPAPVPVAASAGRRSLFGGQS